MAPLLCFRNRRGSYIAEAALVLPFVILSVITAVLIILYFYESSVSESRMHMALRCEAGLVTGKSTAYAENGDVLSPDALWDGSIASSGVSSSKLLRGSKSVAMTHAGLLSRLGRRQLTDELRAVDPVRTLRLRQIVQHDDSADSGSQAGESGVGT